MAKVVHARNTPEGIRFRIWDTSTDTYVSDPITEEELRLKLLFDALTRVLRDFMSNVNQSIDRAQKSGTSSYLDEVVDLDDPWQEELEHEPLPLETLAELQEEWTETNARYKALLEQLLASGYLG